MNSTDEALQLRLTIMERASTDMDFRARLMTDPKTALKEDLGLALSDQAQVTIVEETPQHITLVLPNCTYNEPVEVAAFGSPKLGPIQDMCLFARNVGNVYEQTPQHWQPVPDIGGVDSATPFGR